MLRRFNPKSNNVLPFDQKLRRERIPSRQSQRRAYLTEHRRARENRFKTLFWLIASMRLTFIKCLASLLLVFLRIGKGVLRLAGGLGLFCSVVLPILGLLAFYGHWKVKPDYWSTGFKNEGYSLLVFMGAAWLQMFIEIAVLKLTVVQAQKLPSLKQAIA